MKNVFGIFMGITVNLKIILGSRGIVTISIISTHEHGALSIFSLQFLPSVFYNFHCRILSLTWLVESLGFSM
jgi:hypothetical protein